MEKQIPRQCNRGLQKENKNSAHIMPQPGHSTNALPVKKTSAAWAMEQGSAKGEQKFGALFPVKQCHRRLD
jgi:hypothetical protein